MRTAYHEELSELNGQLARMCGMAGTAMSQATDALLRADLTVAEEVISGQSAIAGMGTRVEELSVKLLALQQPVAGELRCIIGAIHIAEDVDRMGALAQHVAKIARRRHPQHVVPDSVRDLFTEMGRVAVELGNSAEQVLRTRDPHQAARIREQDDTMDDLHRQLFGQVLESGWQHGVAPAVDVVLLGRFYERFADHAVAVGRRVVFESTGVLPVEAKVGG